MSAVTNEGGASPGGATRNNAAQSGDALPFDASKLLERVASKQDLTEAEAGALLEAMAEGTLAPALAGALLIALRMKGEQAPEIRGFAMAMRRLARRPQLPADGRYVDIVGTGGDGSGSLNLSTGAALLAAACGAPVVKHGNRSISSRCGSADVLAALGLPMPLDEAAAAKCFEALNFTFLFAPHYHPAMKQIAQVRGALGVRTVFNILGPLANPAQPPFHVIGAFSEAMAATMAETLSGMNIERAFVVHGARGWDEPTPIGSFVCFDVRPGSVERQVRNPADYGITPCTPEALHGGDAAENAARLKAALAGEDTEAHRDALAIGAGLALEVTGTVKDPIEGIECARAAIRDGSGAKLLDALARMGQGGQATT